MRFLFSRRRRDKDAAEELRVHLDLLTERYVAQGMNEADARAAAHRQLGNITRVREDLHEMNGWQWLDILVRDAHHAIRQIKRAPAFAAVVIITMALGIGANTAILSVAYAVLLKPLPYSHPDEIYSAEVVIPERRQQIPSLPATVQLFDAWQRADTVFSSMTALTPWEASVVGDGEPQRFGAARVATNFFSFLGVPLARGRDFAPDEGIPGKDRVVIISYSMWRARYFGDDSVIGKTIAINGDRYQIIGVASESALVPTKTQLHPVIPFAERVDVWKPLAEPPQTLNNENWAYGVLVRLADPRNRARGEQQLASVLIDLARAQMPGVKTEPVAQLKPMRAVYAANVRVPILLIVAAAVLLLATACASIANVFLARGASRSAEIAMRVALGAGRGRIMSQLLTETLLLALAGGVIGGAIASYGTTVLARVGPDDVRILSSAGINLPFLVSALLVSLLTGALCGLTPVWQANRRELAMELKDAGRTTPLRVGRMRQFLVGVEMALATLLLASAALLLHSFVNIMNSDRGYDVESVLTADLSLFGQRYASGEAREVFYRDLTDRIRALPGVVAAGAINDLPAVSPSDGPSRAIFREDDTDFDSLLLSRPVGMIRAVTPGYFAASGTPLRAGRTFAANESRLVGIVSEALATRLWPGETAAGVIGKKFRQGSNLRIPPVEVVGVVADAKAGGLDREPTAALYRPYPQWSSGPMTLVVRTTTDPATLAAAVKTEIRRLDPDLPITAMRTMREVVASTLAQRRFQVTLTLLFAIVALVLGVVGVYGVTNYAVACRTKDIGVRMALGASRADVMRWMFAVGIRPVMIGLAGGLAGAMIVGGVFRTMLFGITAFDPVSLSGVAMVLLLTAGAACFLPARRAAALAPIAALRHD